MKESQANLVNLYLSRSQQRPLRVHVRENPHHTHINFDSVEEALGETGVAIMSSVLAELYRCREFHYGAVSLILLEAIDPILLERFRSKGLPLLSTFSERIDYADEDELEDRWLWDAIKNSPKLIDMSVWRLKEFRQYPRNLRVLSIKGPEELPDFFPAFNVSIPQVNLDSLNLHQLVITARGRLSQLDQLFSFFSLPALSSLSISTCQRFSDIGDDHATNPANSSVISYRANQLTALCALIRRSGCSLSSLALHVEPFSGSDIISLLELQPSLNELELEIRQTQSSTCFADLCSRMSQTGSPLSPHLRYLSIHEMSYVDQQEYDISDVFDDATRLLDMLGSREMFAQSAGSGIKDVLMKFGRVVTMGETAEGKRHELPLALARRVELIDAMGIRLQYNSMPLSKPGNLKFSSLLCRKCHTPFFDDIPQLPHPDVNNECLRSNTVPSEAEELKLREILESEARDLERLEENIRRVRLILEDLEQRRDALRQTVQRRKSWISPIRKLPVEIIGEIFSHVCPGANPDEYALVVNTIIDAEKRMECPFDCSALECQDENVVLQTTIATTCSLSHVCHWWRHVIGLSPHLWSSLRLNLSKMENGPANLVELYLSRSAQHPLRICICEHPDYTFSEYESIEQTLGKTGYRVFCSVMAELYRCREFHYKFDSDALLYNMRSKLQKRVTSKGLPLLSVFTEVVEDVHANKGNWFWDLVKTSPKLVSMDVKMLKRWQYPKTLQTLKIREQENCEVLLETVSSLPNLRVLYLHDFVPGRIPDLTHCYFGLHNFTITSVFALSYFEHLLTLLTLPALSSLAISTRQLLFTDGDYHYTEDQDSDSFIRRDNQLMALRTLVERSRCSLFNLALNVEPFSGSDIICLLESQPTLVELELEIREPPSSTCFVDLCSRMSQPESPLMPRLRRLSVHQKGYAYQQDLVNVVKNVFELATHLLGMLESRGTFGAAIEDVSVKFSHVSHGAAAKLGRYELPLVLMKRVRELDAAGVRCRMIITLPGPSDDDVDSEETD
ncbi:hypothetical protein VNI00_000605 [Paramarasmius palmivorus]|uniref:F-box domain-containing protein n=1 Tax=Paramarasmius palmivorus TaxID=297713 RepID=A0AAW0E982_9AGAR